MPGESSVSARSGAAVACLAIGVLFVVPMPGRAQQGPSCTAADFDADLQFINGPGDKYTIVIDKRNVSDHPCVVNTPAGPGFVPDRVPGQQPITLCWGRQDNSRIGTYSPLTVDPGRVVREKLSWKTTSTGEAASCVQLQWIAGDVAIALPSLLKKVCSPVDVSLLSLVKPSDLVPADTHEFDLRSDKTVYYAGEWLPLRLSLNGTATRPPGDGCPALYRKQRSPSGMVSFDEVAPLAFQGCRSFTPGYRRGDWQSGFELDSANITFTGLWEHTMQVFRLTGSAAEGRLGFASSNVLRVRVDDPATIPRKWGPKVKGVAVDITLDKDTYVVGEDVPLHLALENFDAPVPVYGIDPLWDPFAARVEVRDAAGRPLRPDEFIPGGVYSPGTRSGNEALSQGRSRSAGMVAEKGSRAARPTRHLRHCPHVGSPGCQIRTRLRELRPDARLCGRPGRGDHTYHQQRNPTAKVEIPRGDHTRGSVVRKNATTGVSTAAARCEIPESLPT